MDLYSADLLLPSITTDGLPVANIGEDSDGVGFGANTPLWSADGFIGIPNAPSDGAAAQGIVLEEGNTKRIIAVQDPRYVDAAGALALGDRAIVTDSEAWVKVTAAQDRIRLRSSGPAGELLVDINGAEGNIVISVGAATSIRLTATEITLTAVTVKVVGILKVGEQTLIVP